MVKPPLFCNQYLGWDQFREEKYLAYTEYRRWCCCAVKFVKSVLKVRSNWFRRWLHRLSHHNRIAICWSRWVVCGSYGSRMGLCIFNVWNVMLRVLNIYLNWTHPRVSPILRKNTWSTCSWHLFDYFIILWNVCLYGVWLNIPRMDL